MVPVISRLCRALASQGGYTMIELVSMMAIIAVLSTLVIANTSVGNKRQQVRDAAGQYVTALKNAESAATSSRTIAVGSVQLASCNDAAATSCPRRAYGVCLTTSASVDGGGKCAVPASNTTPDAFQVYARTRAD